MASSAPHNAATKYSVPLDDCDDDGNYIASERRKSMAPPAMMGAEGTGGNRQSSLMAMNGGRMSLLPGPLASGDGGSNRASMSPKPQGKIQWGAINGDTQVTTDDLVDNLAADEQEAEAMIDGLAAVAGMISAGGAAASEYAFFDVETVSKNNNWAGAKHWKWGSSKAKKAAADAAASTSDRSLRQRNNGGGEEDERGDDDTAMAANDDEAAGASKAKPKKKASKRLVRKQTILRPTAYGANAAAGPRRKTMQRVVFRTPGSGDDAASSRGTASVPPQQARGSAIASPVLDVGFRDAREEPAPSAASQRSSAGPHASTSGAARRTSKLCSEMSPEAAYGLFARLTEPPRLDRLLIGRIRAAL